MTAKDDGSPRFYLGKWSHLSFSRKLETIDRARNYHRATLRIVAQKKKTEERKNKKGKEKTERALPAEVSRAPASVPRRRWWSSRWVSAAACAPNCFIVIAIRDENSKRRSTTKFRALSSGERKGSRLSRLIDRLGGKSHNNCIICNLAARAIIIIIRHEVDPRISLPRYIELLWDRRKYNGANEWS